MNSLHQAQSPSAGPDGHWGSLGRSQERDSRNILQPTWCWWDFLRLLTLTLLSGPDLKSSTPGQESVCSSFQYMVGRFGSSGCWCRSHYTAGIPHVRRHQGLTATLVWEELCSGAFSPQPHLLGTFTHAYYSDRGARKQKKTTPNNPGIYK